MPFKNEHPLYKIWLGMRQRCLKSGSVRYSLYGGRGITICDRWMSFRQFAEDMGPRPSLKHSLDRIDNDGPYSPENCRWATQKEQLRNRRCAVYVSIEGQKYRALELAEKYKLKTDTIVDRASKGMSFADVVSKSKHHNFQGLALGGRAFGAKKKAQTKCQNGHEYTPENTYLSKQGWRRCRVCHKQRARRLNAAKRERGQ